MSKNTIILPNPFLGATHLQIKPMHQGPAQVVKGKKKSKNPHKGVKAGDKGTHIVVILDESSSMSHAQNSTISGFNEFMDGQRNDQEVDDRTWVTTVKFSGNNITNVWAGIDLEELPELDENTYSPGGMTNLLDAVGTAITDVDAALKAKRKRDRPSVLFVIFTDGQENSSHKFDNETLKAMIKNREDKCDWAFTFLGANIDAFEMGNMFGMSTSNTMQYSTNNMAETFGAVSASTTRYRDMKKSGMDTQQVYAMGMFTDDERSQSDE